MDQAALDQVGVNVCWDRSPDAGDLAEDDGGLRLGETIAHRGDQLGTDAGDHARRVYRWRRLKRLEARRRHLGDDALALQAVGVACAAGRTELPQARQPAVDAHALAIENLGVAPCLHQHRSRCRARATARDDLRGDDVERLDPCRGVHRGAARGHARRVHPPDDRHGLADVGGEAAGARGRPAGAATYDSTQTGGGHHQQHRRGDGGIVARPLARRRSGRSTTRAMPGRRCRRLPRCRTGLATRPPRGSRRHPRRTSPAGRRLRPPLAPCLDEP